MTTNHFKNQVYRYGLVKNLVGALDQDHPARLEIESELFAGDEGTDFDELFTRLVDLIVAEWDCRGVSQS